MNASVKPLPGQPAASVRPAVGEDGSWTGALVQRLLPWLLPVGLIAFWQIASALGWLSTRVLPAPVDVLLAAWTQIGRAHV